MLPYFVSGFSAYSCCSNPFGPVIPVGAHGLGNTAPPAFIGDGWNGNSGGWASGECHTEGIGKCGQGPDLAVDPRIMNGYGINPLHIGNLQSPGLCFMAANRPCSETSTVVPRMDYTFATS
mmetsp:Transcript_79512/g.213087  ORF Transcript_79512/g.213087 Transcript_79512/m.213087 type:complete len:121 (+) Transcript_79512:141-503(+)